MQRVWILLILAVLPATRTSESGGQDAVPDAPPRFFNPDDSVSGPALGNLGSGQESPAPAKTSEISEDAAEPIEPDPPRAAPTQPGGTEVFRSSFEDASDLDLDGWPDGWVRKRGAEYPWYLKVGMRHEAAVDGQQALRIDLNGGAAAVFSPPIVVRSKFSYLFEGYLKTDGLNNDSAYYTVTFYDAQGATVQRFTSELLTHAPVWTKVTIGPMVIDSPKVEHAMIGIHVRPGARADLTGSASFDHIRLNRLPSMTLSTSRPYNIYTDAAELEVNCRVSGIFESEPQIEFQLLDIEGRKVLAHVENLSISTARSSTGADQPSQEDLGFHAAAAWKPKLDAPGFYRIRCTFRCRKGLLLEREQTLVLIDPASNPPRGEFGWTLPKGDHPLSLAALERILPQMGINWVKLPLWVSDTDSRRLDQLVAFAERMSQRGIETVGLLTEPPSEARSRFGETVSLQAADIFSTEPELWYPLLEPVMARLSLQVRWWQLGLDDDVSFVGYPNLPGMIGRIKSELQRFGQEVNLGLGWRVFDQQLPSPQPPWDFLTLTGKPQLTDEELVHYLPAFDGRRARRWVSLEPLSQQEYSTETRASDLIHRMLAAKMAGAEGVFVTDPFSESGGLMNADGTPSELLLPWRTTALVLAGSQYLGNINLPNGSQNYVFERDGEVMMVVWNHRNIQECINLGESVRVTDVWGRRTTPKRSGANSVIDVGPLPGFVTGIHPGILRWNMSVKLERSAIPSVFGITHDNGLAVRNTFGQGVSVKARLDLPESWKVAPRLLDFKLATGEDTLQPFGIALPYDASSGRVPVRIDFEVSADQHYTFSVYRQLDVGEDDVTLDVISHLNDRGELEIEQSVINSTDQTVSFKCFLYIPDRRRLMTQVIELTRDRDRKIYRLPEGTELLGKTLWLRAEEINGNRTLNRRFVAEE
jgi:hypothetical protein